MQVYRVPRLTVTTPPAQQARLLRALHAVNGVRTAQLHLHLHEFAIGARPGHGPQREHIETAVSFVGFPLANPESTGPPMAEPAGSSRSPEAVVSKPNNTDSDDAPLAPPRATPTVLAAVLGGLTGLLPAGSALALLWALGIVVLAAPTIALVLGATALCGVVVGGIAGGRAS